MSYDLSLENEGIISPRISGTEFWMSQDRTFETGRVHDRTAWRRTEPLHKAMHLADDVRRKFWTECIEFFFDFAC